MGGNLYTMKKASLMMSENLFKNSYYLFSKTLMVITGRTTQVLHTTFFLMAIPLNK